MLHQPTQPVDSVLIGHWRLTDLSAKKIMAFATRYVPIGYLADDLSLHAYDMPS
jgi:hypothetical protein